TDGVSFTQVAVLGVNAVTYSSTGLVSGTTYTFRVRAYEGANDSAYSNTASATTRSAPAAPSNLPAAPVSPSRIDLSWTDNAANTYTHRVRAYDGPNDSGYSNAAAATTLPAPAAPSGLLATPTSPSRIDLAWTDNAANEQGFKVERATGGGGFSVIATLGANV